MIFSLKGEGWREFEKPNYGPEKRSPLWDAKEVRRSRAHLQRPLAHPGATRERPLLEETIMRRRHKISRKKSRKNFSGNAGTHPKNFRTGMSRGGYRL